MMATNKRAPRGQGSVRQRPDGTWEARATICGKRRSFYGETQRDVVKQMTAARKSADDGAYFEPTRLTVEKWLNSWLSEYVSPSVKPHTLTAYESQCNNHIIPSLGKTKLSALNATQIQKLYNDLLRNDGLSAKSVRNTHGVLHRALEQAVRLRYIAFNPSDACTPPRVVKKEIHPLTEAEMRRFLTVIDGGEPFKNLYMTALFTGMREGELCGLSWNEIDFGNGTILVKQQLSRLNRKGAQFRIAETKNGRSRLITPAPAVLDILREVKREQAENRMKAGRAWSNEWNLVFTNEVGCHMFPQTVLKHFKKAAAAIGRPDARFHDLRHTYAVTSLQEGDDVKTVQQNLGHATASFTLDVYGHVSEKMKVESAARMDAFIHQIKA